MLESVRTIPGPVFLLIYPAVAVCLIVTARTLTANVGTKNIPIPNSSRFGPYAVACRLPKIAAAGAKPEIDSGFQCVRGLFSV